MTAKGRIVDWWKVQPDIINTDPRYKGIAPEPAPFRTEYVFERPDSEWIFIVAGGLLQVPAVEAAHALGYKVAVSDRDLDCPCAGLADHFVELDTFDVDGHVEFVRNWPHGFAAVFTAGADPIVTVAAAGRAADCHHLPVEIARTCARKIVTRVALNAGCVPQPDFRSVDTLDGLRQPSPKSTAMRFDRDLKFKYWSGYKKRQKGDLVDTMSLLGACWMIERERYFQYAIDEMRCDAVIVKATGSSGSRGHTRGAREDFQSERFAREAFERALAFSPGGMVLVEELLSGKELSVETLWYDGTMIPLNAVERPFDYDGAYAIELGHYNPAVLGPDTYRAVWDVMELAGRAVGMDATLGGHIFKGDLILTDDGPQVLELTCRLSGGFDSQKTTPLATGADYTTGALLLALDRPLREAMPYFMPRWRRHAACLAVFGPKEGGIIKEIRGVEEAREIGEVILRFRLGDELPPLTDCAARAGFCFYAASDPIIAGKGARAMVDEIEVIVG